MRREAIRELLIMLERIPSYCCWIFTTTKAGQVRLFEDDEAGDAAPLLSRCLRVELEVDYRAFAARASRGPGWRAAA